MMTTEYKVMQVLLLIALSKQNKLAFDKKIMATNLDHD